MFFAEENARMQLHPLHIGKADSAHAERCVGAGGHDPRRRECAHRLERFGVALDLDQRGGRAWPLGELGGAYVGVAVQAERGVAVVGGIVPGAA